MTDAELSPIARVLGRIPTGLYIVSCRDGDAPVGFVGSFVMQVGFDPPCVCVAVGKQRGPLKAMRAHGHFALSVLDGRSSAVMGAFFRKHPEGETPFDGHDVSDAPSGCPVFDAALGWLDCRIRGEYDAGDHVVVFGEVCAAELRRDGDPSIRLRENGLDY